MFLFDIAAGNSPRNLFRLIALRLLPIFRQLRFLLLE
jgi:hypothetical protein